MVGERFPRGEPEPELRALSGSDSGEVRLLRLERTGEVG